MKGKFHKRDIETFDFQIDGILDDLSDIEPEPIKVAKLTIDVPELQMYDAVKVTINKDISAGDVLRIRAVV